MDSPQIVIVEDEAIIALELKFILEAKGFRIPKILTTGEQAVNYILKHSPDLVLMDIRIKGRLDGIQAVQQIKKSKKVPVIFLTGNTDLISAQQIKQTRPVAILNKPVAEWELMEAIEQALDSRKA